MGSHTRWESDEETNSNIEKEGKKEVEEVEDDEKRRKREKKERKRARKEKEETEDGERSEKKKDRKEREADTSIDREKKKEKHSDDRRGDDVERGKDSRSDRKEDRPRRDERDQRGGGWKGSSDRHGDQWNRDRQWYGSLGGMVAQGEGGRKGPAPGLPAYGYFRKEIGVDVTTGRDAEGEEEEEEDGGIAEAKTAGETTPEGGEGGDDTAGEASSSTATKPVEKNAGMWSAAFTAASGGDTTQSSKFMKLMGIKSAPKEATEVDSSTVREAAKQQNALMKGLERQYEVSREFSHMGRGKGLGFH